MSSSNSTVNLNTFDLTLTHDSQQLRSEETEHQA